MQKQLLLSICALAVCLSLQAQWSISGNSNATSSSKLGTTNSIPLRLFTNNLERMRLDASTGKVSIGTTQTKGKLTLLNNGSTPASSWVTTTNPLFTGFGEATGGSGDFILAMASNTVTTRPNIIGRRARGTLASPLAVVNNDYITSLQASGFDGSAFQNSANVDFFVDGAPSAGSVPTRISLSTGSNIATRKERLKIGSTGNIDFNDGQMFLEQYSGNVGIGTKIASGKLEVKSVDVYSAIRGTNDYVDDDGSSYGVEGYANNRKGSGVGVRGVGGWTGVEGVTFGGSYPYGAIGTSGTSYGWAGSRYGLYGLAENHDYTETGRMYGVYGDAWGGEFNAAGYFSGNVQAYGYITLSDKKFKSGVKPMEHALAGIMKLKPSSYEFKTEEYKGMHLPRGKQLGLIAQEVKEVFPELVTESIHPARYEKDGKKEVSPEVKYEGINYQGLIPVLVASVQEQQQQLEERDKRIKQLETRLNKLEATLTTKYTSTFVEVSAAYLGQASPNPANGSTAIRYAVPQGTASAKLTLTNAKGQLLKEVNIPNRETGQVNLNIQALPAGTYTYTLWVEGQQTASKQLVIAR